MSSVREVSVKKLDPNRCKVIQKYFNLSNWILCEQRP